jgi:hypothetical protein
MRTARSLEAEWKQVLQESVSMVAKEDASTTGHVWAAGSHYYTARSRLARVLKLTNRLFLKFSNFGGAVANHRYRAHLYLQNEIKPTYT